MTLPSSRLGPLVEFVSGYGEGRVEHRVKEERECCEHAPWAVNKEWARRIGAASRVTYEGKVPWQREAASRHSRIAGSSCHEHCSVER